MSVRSRLARLESQRPPAPGLPSVVAFAAGESVGAAASAVHTDQIAQRLQIARAIDELRTSGE